MPLDHGGGSETACRGLKSAAQLPIPTSSQRCVEAHTVEFTMKIGPLENKSTLAPASTDRKPAPGGAAPSSSPEPSAKVELSAAASVIASGLADGSFDAQKVERLSRAIRDGQYQI